MRVAFIDPQEIRMGSPFNVCRLVLEDGDRLSLPDRPWQDIHARSQGQELHALAYWDIQSSPGFRVVVCSPVTGAIHESQRFAGCCKALAWHGQQLQVSVLDGANFYLSASAT
jgi:hypothetical protein